MSTIEPLDPKRPWITDPDDLPGDAKILKAMFNPFGLSSKLSFTRAFLVLSVLSIPLILMLVSATSGEGNALMPLLLLGVLAIFLMIAHVRRLNHAGRSPFLAGIVLLPVLFGLGLFAAVIPHHVVEANKTLAQIEADKADPEAAAARRAAERAAKREASSGDRPAPRAARRGGRPGGRGGRRGRGGGAGGPNQEKEAFDPMKSAIKNASPLPAYVALGSMFMVSLWSLLWVARLPAAVDVKSTFHPLDGRQP